MKKIIFFITLFLFGLINLNALESYVVLDNSSGRVLGGKNIDEKLLIASTTKIMTAIVAIENYDVASVICAGDEIKEVYGSMIYIDKNECMTLYDLLVGLMLRSGNDAAMVIATNTLGYDKFVNKMNEKANLLGMNNTVFSNPHGLDEKNENISTSKDLALLMRYASKNKVFMEIDSIKKYTLTTNIETHIWYNKNKLLSTYKYATGGKIGYTDRSGHIFVSSAKKAKEDLSIVTMKEPDKFNVHKNLYEKYFNKYDKYRILDKNTFLLKENYYKNYHLYIEDNLDIMLNKGELNKVKIKYEIIKKKKIKPNSVVGKAKVYVDDEFINEINIFAVSYESKKESVLSKLFFWKN